MSILIKGMDMPRMPDNIGQGEKIPYIDVRIFADGDAVVSKGTRPYYDKYVAVELPPHGRLIEAEPLESLFVEFAYKNGGTSYSQYIVAENWVTHSPTIIEAEEGE